ncbi:MAG: hypothetical protein QOJ95_739 [Mycobacterium sp.]|nr:hypothetical protein [Mycobacterium sp.]
MSARELYRAAAAAGGAEPPRYGIPLRVMSALGRVGDLVAAVSRRDMELSSLSIRLMHVMPPMDHGKAERELGWHPAPIHDSIERAAHWYRDRTRC